jgi:hypothetical protein
LTLENVNFNGSEVEGCKLSGNTYLCKAWNNITLQGNTQVGVGYNVKAEAGNEIYVIAEAVVPNEMTLSIAPVLDYNSPMPSATSTEVKTFCMDINQYKARLSNKSSIVDTNVVPIIEGNNTSLSKPPFSFSLYPNPASGTTIVEIKGFETSNALISVFDITGKELTIKIESQGNKFELDISTLSKGIYLLKISSFGESKTKQLIIQ